LEQNGSRSSSATIAPDPVSNQREERKAAEKRRTPQRAKAQDLFGLRRSSAALGSKHRRDLAHPALSAGLHSNGVLADAMLWRSRRVGKSFPGRGNCRFGVF